MAQLIPDINFPLLGAMLLAFLLGDFGFHWIWVTFIFYWIQFSERKARERSLQFARVELEQEMTFKEVLKKNNLETVVWLNAIASQMWAKNHQNLSDWLAGILQPILDWSRPSFLNFIKIIEFKLGTVAPIIKGFTVQKLPESAGDHTTLDIDVVLATKVSIQVNVGLAMLTLPVGANDLFVEGTIRLELDYTSRFPGIGLIAFSFLTKPKVNLVLKPLQVFNAMDVPGLGPYLDNLFDWIFESFLTLPKKINVDLDAIMHKPQEISVDPNERQGILFVRVIGARDLEIKKSFMAVGPISFDSYGSFKISNSNADPQNTRFVLNNVNPTFNECFEFRVEDRSKDKLEIEFIARKAMGAEAPIGQVLLPLSDIPATKTTTNSHHRSTTRPVELECKLQSTQNSFVHLLLSFYPIPPGTKSQNSRDVYKDFNIPSLDKWTRISANFTAPRPPPEVLANATNDLAAFVEGSTAMVGKAAMMPLEVSSKAVLAVADTLTSVTKAILPFASNASAQPIIRCPSLVIKLYYGKNLAVRDQNGASDPYVVFNIGDRLVRSTTKMHTINPIWNEVLVVPLLSAGSDKLLRTNASEAAAAAVAAVGELRLTVWDYDLIGSDEHMGNASIPLGELSPINQPLVLFRNVDVALTHVESGVLRIGIMIYTANVVFDLATQQPKLMPPDALSIDDFHRSHSSVGHMFRNKSFSNLGNLSFSNLTGHSPSTPMMAKTSPASAAGSSGANSLGIGISGALVPPTSHYSNQVIEVHEPTKGGAHLTSGHLAKRAKAVLVKKALRAKVLSTSSGIGSHAMAQTTTADDATTALSRSSSEDEDSTLSHRSASEEAHDDGLNMRVGLGEAAGDLPDFLRSPSRFGASATARSLKCNSILTEN